MGMGASVLSTMSCLHFLPNTPGFSISHKGCNARISDLQIVGDPGIAAPSNRISLAETFERFDAT